MMLRGNLSDTYIGMFHIYNMTTGMECTLTPPLDRTCTECYLYPTPPAPLLIDGRIPLKTLPSLMLPKMYVVGNKENLC